MRTTRGLILGLGLVFGTMLGAPVVLSGVDASVAKAALSLFVGDAAAQETISGDCAATASVNCVGVDTGDGGAGGIGIAPGGDGGESGNGGNGGRGGLATVHDVGNAHADASSSVILDNITTGDASAHEVNVDARGAIRPVVVLVAGSFVDTGVDVFAPGGSAQAGTTGGYGITADASGGEGGDGGEGGEGGEGGAAISSGGAGGSIGDIIQLFDE